ncbi:MAG: hypothetical protein H3Z52_10935 [archaeon]|nr:hypothetical protein [archaeon]
MSREAKRKWRLDVSMRNDGSNDFRGLLFEPTYEHEVVILFSLLIPHLKDSFVIDQYRDTFPDCFATRNGQKIGIEFEVLASEFYEHGHHQDAKNLAKCDLLICWKNNIPLKTIVRDGLEFLDFSGHYVEIMALKKIVDNLQAEKSLKFILHGERPDIGEANKERFFDQLKENIDEKRYGWVKELFDQVSQQEDFKVGWSRGKRWFGMRFYVKKWSVDPIGIQGDGSVWINYQGNPAISSWELPQEVQTTLRQMFKHGKQKWPTVPLNTQADLNNIKRTLEILAEYSRHSDIIWRGQQTTI